MGRGFRWLDVEKGELYADHNEIWIHNAGHFDISWVDWDSSTIEVSNRPSYQFVCRVRDDAWEWRFVEQWAVRVWDASAPWKPWPPGGGRPHHTCGGKY